MAVWPMDFLVGDDEYELRRRGTIGGRVSHQPVNPTAGLIFGAEEVGESEELLEMVSEDPLFDPTEDVEDLGKNVSLNPGIDLPFIGQTDPYVTDERVLIGADGGDP